MTDREKVDQWMEANFQRIKSGMGEHSKASLLVLIEKVRLDERNKIAKWVRNYPESRPTARAVADEIEDGDYIAQ